MQRDHGCIHTVAVIISLHVRMFDLAYPQDEKDTRGCN